MLIYQRLSLGIFSYLGQAFGFEDGCFLIAMFGVQVCIGLYYILTLLGTFR